MVTFSEDLLRAARALVREPGLPVFSLSALLGEQAVAHGTGACGVS